MNNIKIIGTGMYIPKNKVSNEYLEEIFNIDNNYIYKRTGIRQRFFVINETIEEIAIKAVENLFSKIDYNKNEIDMIIVATTTTNRLMPGISYLIQKQFKIQKCICMDILAGCSGYINAFDIARNYIALGKISNALIIGVDVLSKYTDKNDINTAIILADGAGVTLIKKEEKEKIYYSNIESNGNNGEILTCNINEKIYMDGKEIYKYAVTKTAENINEILQKTNKKIGDIEYIIPHQSNIKIINSISNRLKIVQDKMYINLENIGNTFNASIPIALNEMYEKKLLKDGDNIILIGYGGGLNLGSILMEV